MFKWIVAGIDGAQESRDAAVLAQAVAAATGADLRLLTAYADPLLPFPLTIGRDVHRQQEAKAMLASVRPALAPLAHTTCVPDFSAARALRRVARDEHADLLVLGSANGTPPGHARAGHTGRQVLHDAPCAFAVAAAGLHERGVTLRRIVVGLDSTPEAHLALAHGEDLARACGAALTAVAVADDRLPPDAMPLGMVAELGQWEDIVELRRRHLAERVEEALAGRDDVGREVRVGDPAEELAAAARDADLLVIGSRRWGRVDRIALGSTAEALCHDAPCSLLMVPRPRDEHHDAPAGAEAGSVPAS